MMYQDSHYRKDIILQAPELYCLQSYCQAVISEGSQFHFCEVGFRTLSPKSLQHFLSLKKIESVKYMKLYFIIYWKNKFLCLFSLLKALFLYSERYQNEQDSSSTENFIIFGVMTNKTIMFVNPLQLKITRNSPVVVYYSL